VRQTKLATRQLLGAR